MPAASAGDVSFSSDLGSYMYSQWIDAIDQYWLLILNDVYAWLSVALSFITRPLLSCLLTTRTCVIIAFAFAVTVILIVSCCSTYVKPSFVMVVWCIWVLSPLTLHSWDYRYAWWTKAGMVNVSKVNIAHHIFPSRTINREGSNIHQCHISGFLALFCSHGIEKRCICSSFFSYNLLTTSTSLLVDVDVDKFVGFRNHFQGQ